MTREKMREPHRRWADCDWWRRSKGSEGGGICFSAFFFLSLSVCLSLSSDPAGVIPHLTRVCTWLIYQLLLVVSVDSQC